MAPDLVQAQVVHVAVGRQRVEHVVRELELRRAHAARQRLSAHAARDGREPVGHLAPAPGQARARGRPGRSQLRRRGAHRPQRVLGRQRHVVLAQPAPVLDAVAVGEAGAEDPARVRPLQRLRQVPRVVGRVAHAHDVVEGVVGVDQPQPRGRHEVAAPGALPAAAHDRELAPARLVARLRRQVGVEVGQVGVPLGERRTQRQRRVQA